MKTSTPLNLLPWHASQRLQTNLCTLKIGAASLVLLMIVLIFSEGLLLWRESHWLNISQQLQQQLPLMQPSLTQFHDLTQQHQRVFQQQQQVNLITTQNQQLMCHLQQLLATVDTAIVLNQLNITATEARLTGQVSTEATFNTWLQQLTTFGAITQQQLKASTTQAGEVTFQFHFTWR